MKILNWNVYKDNKKMQTLIAKIEEIDADIVCLQEVPEKYQEQFLNLYEHAIVSVEGWTYRKTGEKVLIYNIILSKYAISDVYSKDISLNNIFEAWRYVTFTSEFVTATVELDGKQYEISNTHLRCVAPPWVRIKQFEEVLSHIDMSKKNIICGDLNTFSWPLLNLLLWKRYKYSWRELLTNGRKLFDTIFRTHNLINPHRGISTFKLFPVQYDYILVDEEITAKAAYKIKESCGSDHYGLVLEID